MMQLKHRYTGVSYGGPESYGGNQRRSSDPVIKKCGCGLVAALDTLLYLGRCCRWTDVPELAATDEDGPISAGQYEKCLAAMKKAYFPLLYPLGTGGLALAAGMNLFFKRRCLPFHGLWCAAGSRLWERMENMLAADIPVICAVGQNFPRFWEKKGVSLQLNDGSGSPRPGASARAHFITVTALDEEWMRLSSWGKKYYMSRRDFENYVRKTSNPLLCGILHIEHK